MRKLILAAMICYFVPVSIYATTLAFICPSPRNIFIRLPENGGGYYEYLGEFGYSPQSSKAYYSKKYLGKPISLIGNGQYKSLIVNGATGTMSCWYKSRLMSTSQNEVVNLVSPDNMLGTADGSYTCLLGNKKIDSNHTHVSCTNTNIKDCEVVCTSQGA